MYEELNLKKPTAEFLKNTTLSLFEYICEVGMDEALKQIAKDASEDDLECFPHLKEAIQETGARQATA